MEAKEANAMKWWRSLSYNEQDALLEKYITDGEYYITLAKAGRISAMKILEIQEKEGVANAI